MAETLSRAGIGNETLVVAYDNHPAMQFATRLWWVLKYYGHDNVRVLNGGWAKWNSEGRTVTSGNENVDPEVLVQKVNWAMRVNAEEVLNTLGRPDTLLVDARDEGQFSGRLRRAQHGGHIPGAINLPREALIGPDDTFRSTDELAQQIAGAGITPDRKTIAYCNGGVAATTILFALSMLGNENSANYDGSWNEWGNREDLPVEKV
jgi:thiosulfate/3-mercaptopyruvate sulfurtransferase